MEVSRSGAMVVVMVASGQLGANDGGIFLNGDLVMGGGVKIETYAKFGPIFATLPCCVAGR